MHACTHAHTHACMYTHTQTHTHTHTNTHPYLLLHLHLVAVQLSETGNAEEDGQTAVRQLLDWVPQQVQVSQHAQLLDVADL